MQFCYFAHVKLVHDLDLEGFIVSLWLHGGKTRLVCACSAPHIGYLVNSRTPFLFSRCPRVDQSANWLSAIWFVRELTSKLIVYTASCLMTLAAHVSSDWSRAKCEKVCLYPVLYSTVHCIIVNDRHRRYKPISGVTTTMWHSSRALCCAFQRLNVPRLAECSLQSSKSRLRQHLLLLLESLGLFLDLGLFHHCHF